MPQLSGEFCVHGNHTCQWRQQVLDKLPRFFSDSRKREDRDKEGLLPELYYQISQLKIDLEWLKKKSELLHDQKKRLISTWVNPAGGLAVTETEIDAAYGFEGHLPKTSIEHIFSGA